MDFIIELLVEVNSLVKVMNADDNDGTGVDYCPLLNNLFTLNDSNKRYTFNFVFDSEFSIRDAIEEVKKGL